MRDLTAVRFTCHMHPAARRLSAGSGRLSCCTAATAMRLAGSRSVIAAFCLEQDDASDLMDKMVRSNSLSKQEAHRDFNGWR